MSGDFSGRRLGSHHSNMSEKCFEEALRSPPRMTDIALRREAAALGLLGGDGAIDSRSRANTARLTDLCAADKSRVARLIEQLLRVTTEHDRAVEDWNAERGTFESRIQRLRKQNDDIVGEMAALRKKFGQTLALAQQYQERIAVLQRFEDEVASTRAKAQHAESEVLASREQRDQARHQLEIVNQELQSSQKTASVLREEIQEHRNQRDQVLQERNKLQSQVAQLKAELDSALTEAARSRDTVAELGKQAQALQHERDELRVESLSLTRNAEGMSLHALQQVVRGREEDKYWNLSRRWRTRGEFESGLRVQAFYKFPDATSNHCSFCFLPFSPLQELSAVKKSLASLCEGRPFALSTSSDRDQRPTPVADTPPVPPRLTPVSSRVDRLLRIQEGRWSSSRDRDGATKLYAVAKPNHGPVPSPQRRGTHRPTSSRGSNTPRTRGSPGRRTQGRGQRGPEPRRRRGDIGEYETSLFDLVDQLEANPAVSS